MNPWRGFTLIELLVVVAITATIVAIFLLLASQKPGRGGRAPHMKNGTQLRGIMMGFAMWSDANTITHDLPGGITGASSNWSQNGTDGTVVGRFWTLLAPAGIDPMTPSMLINPIVIGTDTVRSYDHDQPGRNPEARQFRQRQRVLCAAVRGDGARVEEQRQRRLPNDLRPQSRHRGAPK